MPEPSCVAPVGQTGQTIVFCGLPAGEAGRFGSPTFLLAAEILGDIRSPETTQNSFVCRDDSLVSDRRDITMYLRLVCHDNFPRAANPGCSRLSAGWGDEVAWSG
jgi:hypothetical protein